MDFKESGNLLYLVGQTRDELGGSHFVRLNQLGGGRVPEVDFALAPLIFQAVHDAIGEGLVRSCHDLSEGGLVVATAEAAFAGGLGADVSLHAESASAEIEDDASLLFSESNTRFLIEVPPDVQNRFETVMANCPCFALGKVHTEPVLRFTGRTGNVLINSKLNELKLAWQRPLQFDAQP